MIYTADDMLDKVEEWADGCILIREIGGFIKNGRIDGLLLPVGRAAPCMNDTRRKWFDRPGLIGIDVKVSRSDFLKGLREGQYEKYDQELSGLYIAAPKHVAKLSEIPKQFGFITTNGKFGKNESLVCRRHPKFEYKPIDHATAFRLMFKMTEHFKNRERRFEETRLRFEKKVRIRAGQAINHIIRASKSEVQ